MYLNIGSVVPEVKFLVKENKVVKKMLWKIQSAFFVCLFAKLTLEQLIAQVHLVARVGGLWLTFSFLKCAKSDSSTP